MEHEIGSPESSPVQSKVRTASTACQPLEASREYFGNEDVRAKTSPLSNHDLVQKALELASVSPYKINRKSGHFLRQNPEDVYDREHEGFTAEDLKDTFLKSTEDHLNVPITQNVEIHHFVDQRFDNVHEARCSELKANNKYAKIINTHLPTVSGACSTSNNIYPGNGYMPLSSIISLPTDLRATASSTPLVMKSSEGELSVIRPMPVTYDVQPNSSFFQRFTSEKNQPELKGPSRTERRPISFFQRLTRRTRQPVSESHNSIVDPSEESLVSLIDSVNEYSESQTRCVSDLAASETSPIKNGPLDIFSTSMSPQSKPETPPTNKKKTGRSMECRLCHKRVSILSLKIHMKRHYRETQLRAHYTDLNQTCESSTSLLTDYKPKKVTHQPKRYICPVCGKRFTRSSYLKIHARIHTGETPFSCSLCDKKFKYKRSFTEHVADHKQIKLYHCDICDKKYNRQSGFDAHRRNHRQQDGAIPKVDIVVADKKSVPTIDTTVLLDTDSSVADEACAVLDSQIVYSKKGRGFTCSICKQYFAKEHLIRTHIKIHEVNMSQSFTCSMCAEKLPSVNSLKSHIVQHAVDIYNKSLDVVCVPNRRQLKTSYSVENVTNLPDASHTVNSSRSTSSKEFDSEENKTHRNRKKKIINEHVKHIKSSNRIKNRKSKPTTKLLASKDYEPEIDCAAEDVATEDTGDCSDDVRSSQDDGGGNVIFCSECDKVLKSKKQLTLHLKTHKPSKFVCKECGRDYKTQYNFQKHLTWHETKQEIKTKRDTKAECEICAKSVRLDCMKNHIRTHTGERPFQCDYCGAAFKQGTHLKTHIKIHTGEKPHQCICCGQVFRKTGNLVVHMRNHTGEKPYKCNVCNERFKHLAIYKEHLASHRGISLYQCEFCGHKYKSRSGYDCHKRRNHKKDSLFKCYSCGVIYKTSKEVIGCPCSDNTTSQSTATEVVVITETIAPPQPLTHTNSPVSLVYSNMMGILNHPASNENEIISPSFQH